MMNRRAFAVGLGAMGLGTVLPAKQVWAEGSHRFDKLRNRRDIPFTPFEQIPNHRQFMRDIVIALSSYAKSRNPHFVILARNAPELLVKDPREWELESGQDRDGAASGKYVRVGDVVRPYLQAIDGMLIDGLFCGMDQIDQATDETDAKPFFDALAQLRKGGRRGLSIEYARDKNQAAAAQKKAEQTKILTYIDQDGDKSFAHIPAARPPLENPQHVTSLEGARNFLPMMRGSAFGSKEAWIAALAETNYDLLLIDPFWQNEVLTTTDVKALQLKRLGSRRLVLADLSVGRAQKGRFYWKTDWKVGSPAWLVDAAPDQPAQTMVRYWDDEWKTIIGKYMQGLVDLGVDGVLLDDLDSYFYFEAMMPIR
jgi:endo-alpha-1,4-polygalactosaminidase (GH114 family)